MEGSGKHDFWKSNLFIFLLGQGFAFVCWLVIFAFGWGKYSERFTSLESRMASIETKATRMDEHGSNFMQHVQDEQTKTLGELRAKVDAMEKDTAHFDVMEAEHLRLTKDVENLKNEKK